MNEKILAAIKAAIGSTTDEQFIDQVIKRLESFGYTVVESDAWAIAFAIMKVENHIKNSCNTALIPDGLTIIAVDMVCGEFLFAKKQSGTLIGFDLEAAVKQVQAGDTNVTFALGDGSYSPEQRLDSLLSFLMSRGEGDFTCYRKIKW